MKEDTEEEAETSTVVHVTLQNGIVLEADMVVCTLPLSILKNSIIDDPIRHHNDRISSSSSNSTSTRTRNKNNGEDRTGLKIKTETNKNDSYYDRTLSMVTFEPPLPYWKQLAIERLGTGLLNKCILSFPFAFWPTSSNSTSTSRTKQSKKKGSTTQPTPPETDVSCEQPSTGTSSTTSNSLDDTTAFIGLACAKRSYLLFNGTSYTGDGSSKNSNKKKGYPFVIFLFGGALSKSIDDEWTDEDVVYDCCCALQRICHYTGSTSTTGNSNGISNTVPNLPCQPIDFHVTRWGHELYSQMAFTYVPPPEQQQQPAIVGLNGNENSSNDNSKRRMMSGFDALQTMSEPIYAGEDDNHPHLYHHEDTTGTTETKTKKKQQQQQRKIPLIMFAGEHTTPYHPSTIHGAFLSGIREAYRIDGVLDTDTIMKDITMNDDFNTNVNPHDDDSTKDSKEINDRAKGTKESTTLYDKNDATDTNYTTEFLGDNIDKNDATCDTNTKNDYKDEENEKGKRENNIHDYQQQQRKDTSEAEKSYTNNNISTSMDGYKNENQGGRGDADHQKTNHSLFYRIDDTKNNNSYNKKEKRNENDDLILSSSTSTNIQFNSNSNNNNDMENHHPTAHTIYERTFRLIPYTQQTSSISSSSAVVPSMHNNKKMKKKKQKFEQHQEHTMKQKMKNHIVSSSGRSSSPHKHSNSLVVSSSISSSLRKSPRTLMTIPEVTPSLSIPETIRTLRQRIPLSVPPLTSDTTTQIIHATMSSSAAVVSLKNGRKEIQNVKRKRRLSPKCKSINNSHHHPPIDTLSFEERILLRGMESYGPNNIAYIQKKCLPKSFFVTSQNDETTVNDIRHDNKLEFNTNATTSTTTTNSASSLSVRQLRKKCDNLYKTYIPKQKSTTLWKKFVAASSLSTDNSNDE